jgi:hypothetical protein
MPINLDAGTMNGRIAYSSAYVDGKNAGFLQFDDATDWQPSGGNVSPFADGGICCGARHRSMAR